MRYHGYIRGVPVYEDEGTYGGDAWTKISKKSKTNQPTRIAPTQVDNLLGIAPTEKDLARGGRQLRGGLSLMRGAGIQRIWGWNFIGKGRSNTNPNGINKDNDRIIPQGLQGRKTTPATATISLLPNQRQVRRSAKIPVDTRRTTIYCPNDQTGNISPCDPISKTNQGSYLEALGSRNPCVEVFVLNTKEALRLKRPNEVLYVPRFNLEERELG